MTAEVLQFPPRGVLRLLEAVDGVLRGTTEPEAALIVAEEALVELGATKDENGEWIPPAEDGDATNGL